MRLAHIAAHTGGGVGSVLQSFFELSQVVGVTNDLFCLDNCEEKFADLSVMGVFRDGLSRGAEPFIEHLVDYDVIVLHYWNHPLMAEFTAMAELPRRRLAVWAHNSGLFEPHPIPDHVAAFADVVLFTNACSFRAPNLRRMIKYNPAKFTAVHSTHVLDQFMRIGANRTWIEHVKKLLYVGTVSSFKMHPESAELFCRLSQLGFAIQVVGGPEHSTLARDVAQLGGEIEIFGQVGDVKSFYQDADIFIYPLRREHYGTGEQVVLEAMASGLPVVAFRNPAEEVILGEGSGLLVNSTDEFLEAVGMLAAEPDLRKRMSERGRERVATEFNAAEMTARLLNIFSDLVAKPKSVHAALTDHPGSVDAVGLYALNSFFEGSAILERITRYPEDGVRIVLSKIEAISGGRSGRSQWCGKSKSTPLQYLKYFPQSAAMGELVYQLGKKID